MNDQTEAVKKPRATRSRSTADMRLGEADVVESLTGTRVEFGDRTRARRGSHDAELNLSIPEGTIPSGMVGRWIEDRGGKVQRALDGWYGFVKDKQGVNITRVSGNVRMILMAKMEEHHKEDRALKESRYRASIGEDAKKPLGEGVESYTPEGADNKIKVTSDPFAS